MLTETTTKIAELELWLMENPENENRSVIESDLRRLRESLPKPETPLERDTFCLRDHTIYDL